VVRAKREEAEEEEKRRGGEEEKRRGGGGREWGNANMGPYALLSIASGMEAKSGSGRTVMLQ
jgi:hypothetical protein